MLTTVCISQSVSSLMLCIVTIEMADDDELSAEHLELRLSKNPMSCMFYLMLSVQIPDFCRSYFIFTNHKILSNLMHTYILTAMYVIRNTIIINTTLTIKIITK